MNNRRILFSRPEVLDYIRDHLLDVTKVTFSRPSTFSSKDYPSGLPIQRNFLMVRVVSKDVKGRQIVDRYSISSSFIRDMANAITARYRQLDS